MSFPLVPYIPFYELTSATTYGAWFRRYQEFSWDILVKTHITFWDALVRGQTPRWYGRLVTSIYPPMERAVGHFFFQIGVDYESLLVGYLYGTYVACRHFVIHEAKTIEYRPMECLCTHPMNHFYMKWKRVRQNPRKYWRWDRRAFYKRLFLAAPWALVYGAAGAVAVHVFSSLSLNAVERAFPIYWTSLYLSYWGFEDTEWCPDYQLFNMRFTEHLGFSFIFLYSLFRTVRNFSASVPFERNMIG